MKIEADAAELAAALASATLVIDPKLKIDALKMARIATSPNGVRTPLRTSRPPTTWQTATTCIQPLGAITLKNRPGALSGSIAGMGMKCRKKFDPNTMKPRPSSTRARRVMTLMFVLYRAKRLRGDICAR